MKVRWLLLVGLLVSLWIAAPVLGASSTVVLDGQMALASNATYTNADAHMGYGAWRGKGAGTGSKAELYINPTVEPFDVLGTFLVKDIESITYWTNKPDPQTAPDWYINIYTVPGSGPNCISPPTWYCNRITIDPMYGYNINAPANQWNMWSTESGTNQMTVYDSRRTNAGFYNGPTLDDIQAGPINWGDYPNSGSTEVVDYSGETVKYIVLATGNPWADTFVGKVDELIITLKNGNSLTLDLEGGPAVVYVDDDWAGTTPGEDPDGDGPATSFGWDAFDTIQGGVGNVGLGGVVNVAAGNYAEIGQIVIGHNMSIVGEGADVVTVTPTADTGTSGDARGWWLVDSGVDFDLSGVTLDGTGYKVWQGIRHKGSGTITDVVFQNIQYEASGPAYSGVGVAAFGGNVEFYSCDFSNIGRVGVLFFGPDVTAGLFSNSTYTGKGDGDWLDYGVEVGGGAVATIENSTIRNNTGVASVDGSTSAAILVTTYYGAGTTATITDNFLFDSTTGIYVGYDSADTSTVAAHNNYIMGNEWGAVSTNPLVDAENNWWGCSGGPGAAGCDPVDGPVDFEPWIIVGNGSFEYDFFAALFPTYWTPKNFASGDKWICTKPAADGLCFVQLRGDGGNKQVIQLGNLAGSAGDQFDLSAWAQGKNVSGTARIRVVLYNTDGTKQKVALNFGTGTYDWTEFTWSFTANKDYNQIKVKVQYSSTGGKLRVDDIVLERIPVVPPPAPAFTLASPAVPASAP